MGMRITVAFSPVPRVVQEIELVLQEGATVGEALAASIWSGLAGELSDGAFMLGVWGRKARPDQTLRDRDRVEIHRALTVDPKMARRARFVKQGVRATGLFARKRPGAKAGY